MMLQRASFCFALPALLLAAAFGGAQPAVSSGKSEAVQGGARREQPLPIITVEASYPGANAQVLADTVASPIEQQVHGVEGMRYLSSRCTNDGNYRLKIVFPRGVDAAKAQVLVQNRVNLALSLLPDGVKQTGVTVKVRLEADPRISKQLDELSKLKVRNGAWEMIPLGKLVKINKISGPLAIDRLNTQPAVQITANPAPGVALPEARAACEALAAMVQRELRLPADYRLTWLTE